MVRGEWSVRPEKVYVGVHVCVVHVVFPVVRVGPGRTCLVAVLEMDNRPRDAKHEGFLLIWRYGPWISPLEVLQIRHQRIVVILTVVIVICMKTNASTVIGCNACWAYWLMYFYDDDIVCHV